MVQGEAEGDFVESDDGDSAKYRAEDVTGAAQHGCDDELR